MSASYWMSSWPYRTRLISKKGDGNRWVLVELCDKMQDLLDPYGKIPQAKEPVGRITFLHVVKIEGSDVIGKVLEMTKMSTKEQDDNLDFFKELMEDYEPQGTLETFPEGGVWKRKVTSSPVTSCGWVTLR